MMQLLGILLIVTAAYGIGTAISRSLRLEYRRLVGFEKLLRLIRARIECFNQPLSSIYADFSEEALDECGFSEELKRSGFTEALCRCRDRLGLRRELLALLAEFGASLGKSFSEEQLRHCDRYIALLGEKAAVLEKELPVRQKTVRTLTAAAAVMASILLI